MDNPESKLNNEISELRREIRKLRISVWVVGLTMIVMFGLSTVYPQAAGGLVMLGGIFALFGFVVMIGSGVLIGLMKRLERGSRQRNEPQSDKVTR